MLPGRVSLVAAIMACLATALPAQAANLLEHLVVVEAEQCTDAGGTPVTGPKETRSARVFLNADAEASGGHFITPVPLPYRIFKPFPEPVEAKTEVTIPVAGRWHGHVRYLVTPERLAGMEYRKITRTVKHFHACGPFQVGIGGQRFTVGADQTGGARFRWDRFAVDLPAGRTTIQFLMPDMAGVDCLVLSRAADYAPDTHDYEGPLWLRFKVLRGADRPFLLRCRCHFNPYEIKRPKDAGWLLKDTVAGSAEEADRLQEDSQRLLGAGQWSPWVRTFTATKKHFFAEVAVLPGPGKADPAAKRNGLDRIEMAFQAATRPDETMLVREGIESTGEARGVYILLPTAPGLDTLRREVRGFSQWADDRLALVRQLGVQPGEGPRRIEVLTMNAFVRTPREIDVFLETCRLLGFNGCDVQPQFGDPRQLWDRVANDGFTWTQAHHLAPAYALSKWLDLPAAPLPGQSMQQAVDAFWYEQSLARIHQLWDNRPESQRQRIGLANLVDEPGPVPSFIVANCIPAIRLCFHDFLRAHGVDPAVLGKRGWDAVDVVGYQSTPNPGLATLLAQMNIDLKYVESGGAARFERLAGKQGEKPRYRAEVPVHRGLRTAGPEEKRQYYWSQRFRSFLSRHFYGQTARAVEDLARQGWLPKAVKTTPNFQAAPMMDTQMWDGGLDLFEWARDGTTNCLMMEDWINDPYRVGFGLSLLRAAARKRGQSLGLLIVADRHFRQRYLTGLAQGASLFVDYLYGPVGVIGPAWAESPEAVRDRAEMLRWTRRCEDDLLASRPRQADTAILVANSSEINTAYYSACAAEAGLKFRAAGGRPLFRRAGIYATLLDGGAPAEIVSETEILEDKAMDRYKALYVVDTHVVSAVQEAIRAWVHHGGTLWADYTALARNEFDEDSRAMDEVFGLAARGPLPQPASPPAKDAAPEKIRAVAGEILEEVAFDGSLFHPAWKLSTGKPLARFADGSPALVLNQFGKGRAVLVGCSALMLSPYASQSEANGDFAKARRVALLGAELAGAARPCRVSAPRVHALVRDGKNQTVLVLINATDAAQAGVEVRLTVPRRVQSAFDARNRAVTLKQKDGEVQVFCNLEQDDGDILVFKW